MGRRVGSACGILACVGALLLAPAPAAQAWPMHVMSMNQCSDQLVLMLLPLNRISSVTYLAESGAVTPEIAAKARRARINYGTAEDVLAQKPDLIVAGLYTTAETRKLAKRIGIPVIEQPPANSFADIRQQLRVLGAAVGESARAEAIVAGMDATLAKLARSEHGRTITAVGWDASGRVPGKTSLFEAMLNAAGGENVAAGPGTFERNLNLEQLLTLKPRPELLLYGALDTNRFGLRRDSLDHPVLRRAFGRRRIAFPENVIVCGTPQLAQEAVRLRQAMLSALGDGGSQ